MKRLDGIISNTLICDVWKYFAVHPKSTYCRVKDIIRYSGREEEIKSWIVNYGNFKITLKDEVLWMEEYETNKT